MYKQAGDIGNVLLLTCTLTVTACMLNKWPNEELFDNNWLTNGFCVSNPESTWTNSHILSFYADTVLALIIGYIYVTEISGRKDAVPPIHEALIRGSIMGVFGHGLGHLNLSLEPTGMDLRMRADDISASIKLTMMNVFGFGSIFLGAMPLASKKKVLVFATLATLGFTLLDIAPKLNFVYAQAAIYTASAFSMLSLSSNQKDATLYSLYPYFQLPVLVVGILESTGCEKILAPIGGHACFDSIIAVSTILLHFISTHMDKQPKGDGYVTKKRL